MSDPRLSQVPVPISCRSLVRTSDIAAVVQALAHGLPLTATQMTLLRDTAEAIGLTGGIALIDPACHPLTAAAIRAAEGFDPIDSAKSEFRVGAKFCATMAVAKHAPWTGRSRIPALGRCFVVAESPERLSFMLEAAVFGLDMGALAELNAGPATKQIFALMFTAGDAQSLGHRWRVPDEGAAPDLDTDLIDPEPAAFSKERPTLGWLLIDIADALLKISTDTTTRAGLVRKVSQALQLTKKVENEYIAALHRDVEPPKSEVVARRALGFPPRRVPGEPRRSVSFADFPGDEGAARAIVRACASVVNPPKPEDTKGESRDSSLL